MDEKEPIVRGQVWRHKVSKIESTIMSAPEAREHAYSNVIHRGKRRVRWTSEPTFRRTHEFTGRTVDI